MPLATCIVFTVIVPESFEERNHDSFVIELKHVQNIVHSPSLPYKEIAEEGPEAGVNNRDTPTNFVQGPQ